MKLLWIALPVMLLAACVTTNIYFPAQAVENAADKIIGEIWPLSDQPVLSAKEKK
jgi:dTDP-4-dehydrorhamnose 3,5-epimerase-like enzyme